MRTLANFKVIRMNGDVYDVSEHDLFVHTFQIDPPYGVQTTDSVPGMHGDIGMGTDLRRRAMRAECTLRAPSHQEFDSSRNKVFNIFRSDEPFYIIRDAEPNKRWLINEVSAYIIEREDTRGRFMIEFISNSPYCHSIGTTQGPLSYESGLWLGSQTLLPDGIDYSHNTATFSIFNGGDATINPRFMELSIKYKGASTNLKIKNNTTGEEWAYTGSSNAGDTIELNRIRSLKNNLSIVALTNFKAITIAPGWNEFILTGTSGSFEISFDFRFHFF